MNRPTDWGGPNVPPGSGSQAPSALLHKWRQLIKAMGHNPNPAANWARTYLDLPNWQMWQGFDSGAHEFSHGAGRGQAYHGGSPLASALTASTVHPVSALLAMLSSPASPGRSKEQ